MVFTRKIYYQIYLPVPCLAEYLPESRDTFIYIPIPNFSVMRLLKRMTNYIFWFIPYILWLLLPRCRELEPPKWDGSAILKVAVGKSFFKPQLCILHHFHHMYCTCLLGLKEWLKIYKMKWNTAEWTHSWLCSRWCPLYRWHFGPCVRFR